FCMAKQKLIEKKYKSNLSNNQNNRYLIDFIESNPDLVIQLSAKELSVKVFCSQSTLTRFIQSLGFENYRLFQLYIQKRKYIVENNDLELKEEGQLSIHDIINNIHKHYKFSIEDAFERYSENFDNIREYIRRLKYCKNHIIFGIGESSFVGSYLSKNLNKIGITTHNISSVHDFFGLSHVLKDNCFVTVITRSSNTAEIFPVLSHLINNRIRHCVWTRNKSLERNDIRNVLIVNSLPQQHRITSAGSKIGFLFLADLIYFILVNRVDPKFSIFDEINSNIKKWNDSNK
ncbi:MurR/RpiR family transcriptional regulator, partial [Mycoplasmopsis pullorum]|uniref:MurR/RpiR family transcriptional regulator n=4 Tax=Mycoplasmopsis pullorum TaxID=48003 RepID=UPI001C58554F